jgi:hypothetical protein
MQKPEIAREILAYLVDHPDAQDTLEGVVQWWLLERKIKYWTKMVKQTLAELVAKGFILEHRGEDAQIRYRLNTDKHERIRAFLKEMGKAK